MTEYQPLHPDAGRFGGWSWDEPYRGEHFRRCSFCGSVHPDDLAAETVWHADWADRKYGWPHKFYVNIVNRDPERLFVMGSTSGGPADRPLDPGYTAWGDLTDEQRAMYEREGRPVDDRHPAPLGVMFGTQMHHHGKFYTVHLSDPAITAEVKEAIERRCGLQFTFEQDPARTIRWKPYPYLAEPKPADL